MGTFRATPCKVPWGIEHIEMSGPTSSTSSTSRFDLCEFAHAAHYECAICRIKSSWRDNPVTLARDLKNVDRLAYAHLPVCIAKTHSSLSDNPKLRGRPKDGGARQRILAWLIRLFTRRKRFEVVDLNRQGKVNTKYVTTDRFRLPAFTVLLHGNDESITASATCR